MRGEALKYLRCPACHGSLRPSADVEELVEGALTCDSCGRSWPVQGGIPHLVFPEELYGQDARSQRLWNRIARFWGAIAFISELMTGQRSMEERRRLVRRLQPRPGDAVLEIATGTGTNLKLIADEMPGEGTIFGMDLSPRMLAQAAGNLRDLRPPPHLVLANAVHLPFADTSFDGVLDGFGMKYYSDKPRAMLEMLRVVKPGGIVAVADLGLPQGKPLRFRQRLLSLWIPGMRDGPPVDVVPSSVTDLKVHWDAQEIMYTIEFRRPAA